MVEQNASLALSIAHRAYVLRAGRIVLEGAAPELTRDPRIRDAYLGGDRERASSSEAQYQFRASST
jgi:branched-chain amino acid transport system ATP-binding protein